MRIRFSAQVAFLLPALLLAGCEGAKAAPKPAPTRLVPASLVPYQPPSEAAIPNDERGKTIRYGRLLITQTGVHAKAYVGNALSCSNCHLDAGRKQKAAPYVGVYAAFPQYRSRSARVDTLEDRINDCFLRSENGTALPYNSPEMRAIVTYMAWLSQGVPAGRLVEGHGFVKMTPPRAPDKAKGRQIYASTCAVCHGPEGQGQVNFPPLWGPRSFNIGAGMARLNTAASFIKWNMPLNQGGTLSDEQAFDVAAFVLAHPRPDYAAKKADWPKGDKPKDTPY